MPSVARCRIVRRHGEFIVQAYDAQGARMPSADYFTHDRGDAHQTARLMIGAPVANGCTDTRPDSRIVHA